MSGRDQHCCSYKQKTDWLPVKSIKLTAIFPQYALVVIVVVRSFFFLPTTTTSHNILISFSLTYKFFLSSFTDAPTIRLIGSPEIDLEEDKDALILRCVADANPPASIVWRRAGRSEIASLQVSQCMSFRHTQAHLYMIRNNIFLPIWNDVQRERGGKKRWRRIAIMPRKFKTQKLFYEWRWCDRMGNKVIMWVAGRKFLKFKKNQGNPKSHHTMFLTHPRTSQIQLASLNYSTRIPTICINRGYASTVKSVKILHLVSMAEKCD